MPQRPGQFEPHKLWQEAREPTFWLDAALRLAWVNRAWETLTGHTSEEVVGLTSFAHAPTRANDLADLAASFHPPPESLAGHAAGTPTLIFQAGGEPIRRRLEFWPFRDEHDTLIGLLGVVRDPDSHPSVPESQANRLHVELLEVRRRLEKQPALESLLGLGPAHRRLLDQVRLAADSAAPVLVVGEAGTGKRQVARAIHQNGPGRHQAFVSFDCEALPAEILERELFATEQRAGSAEEVESPAGFMGRPRLSLSAGGTLLIRDIFLLPRDLQARLAASLESQVRVIGTTTLEPDDALRQERIRPELYYALTTLVVRLRPLRDRRGELPVLAQHLLERANQRGGKQRLGFLPETLSALSSYDWPGNMHELTRVVDHAHAAGGGDRSWVTVEDLPSAIRGILGGAYLPPSAPSLIKPLDQLLTEVEQRSIETALRHARGNKSRAADLLGISRPRLYRRMKELNLPDEGEPPEDTPAAI
jgi:DNA-binding NtrC family response regulator